MHIDRYKHRYRHIYIHIVYTHIYIYDVCTGIWFDRRFDMFSESSWSDEGGPDFISGSILIFGTMWLCIKLSNYLVPRKEIRHQKDP